MRSYSRTRVVLTTTAVALAALVAACSSPPAPPAPPPVVQAPPPPPPITLSASLVERASAFRGYMGRAAAVSSAFQNGDQIQAALKVGAAYEPKSFMNGAVAYAAVLALQDPTFVASVREVAADPAQRQQMIANIFSNPSYGAVFKGADSAAGLIIDTLGNDGLKVYMAGKAVKQSAYDVQKASWSKSFVVDRDGRLASAKSLSTTPALAESADVAVLQSASTGGQSLGQAALRGHLLPGPAHPDGHRRLHDQGRRRQPAARAGPAAQARAGLDQEDAGQEGRRQEVVGQEGLISTDPVIPRLVVRGTHPSAAMRSGRMLSPES
jgi:hypothetical protein